MFSKLHWFLWLHSAVCHEAVPVNHLHFLKQECIRSLIRTVAILQASAIFMIVSSSSSAIQYKDLIKVVKITDNRCDLLNYK